MDIDRVNQSLLNADIVKIKNQKTSIGNQSLEEKELKEACAGFEAILMHNMLKSMRKSMPGDALLDNSHSMAMYKSMYDQYLAEELSKVEHGGSLGIKEFLYEELKESI